MQNGSRLVPWETEGVLCALLLIATHRETSIGRTVFYTLLLLMQGDAANKSYIKRCLAMEIIEARIDHLEDVYKLLCELENETLDKSKFTQIYRDNMYNSNIHYFLAIDELNVVGFASLHLQKLLHHCAQVGEIQEIIISKNQQGKGTGTALFNKLKETAIRYNCLLLEVCCNVLREKSHNFYLKQDMKKSHYKFTYQL